MAIQRTWSLQLEI